MSSTLRMLAAAALLALLGGCAWMPNWSPNTASDTTPTYEQSLSD